MPVVTIGENSGSTTSSVPPVIWPLPLALKAPANAIYAPFASAPEVEKAYVPLRLVLEKPPVGGGVAEGELLPQPTRNARVSNASEVRTKRLRDNDIEFPRRRFSAQNLDFCVQVSTLGCWQFHPKPKEKEPQETK